MSLAVRRDGEGFSDSMTYDFADPTGGACGLVRVDLGPSGGRAASFLSAGDGATIGSGRGIELPSDWGSIDFDGLSVSDDGERARVVLEDEGAGLEIEVERLRGATIEPGTAFSDASGLTQELFVTRVEGSWHAFERTGTVSGPGRLVRTSGELDWGSVELVRSLCAVLEDGSLLGIAAARPAGAAGHGDDAVTALLLDPDGLLTRFEESLLSTEYDSEGSLRRAGLELWGPDEDAPALRGAGTLIRSGADTAFLRFKLDGTPGTARYELVRKT